MEVRIEAFMELPSIEECIKRAALEAIVDEMVRRKGSFVSELFHPGPWERFRECTRPKARVELSAGGLFIARGDEDYLNFAEAILSIGALIRGESRRAAKLAELTGMRLLAEPRDGGIRLSFAGFYGVVKLSKDRIVFSTDGSTLTVPIGSFLEAEGHFLNSLAFDLEELFEACSRHGLGRAFLENTGPIRLLLKVIGYENGLGRWGE
ncbi:hypothetical protein [Thermococcus sp. 21S7]|uniref:hypothetical protein n=1 Tax=Thermococcus sp. 21S7 TaxID=1638221 RepID=UPI00143C7524|nr:hypothetical protein [Thermococcus sp. 21S7]NJE61089.1 hypothetical protein [Thermococcus sp. 21S7]